MYKISVFHNGDRYVNLSLAAEQVLNNAINGMKVQFYSLLCGDYSSHFMNFNIHFGNLSINYSYLLHYIISLFICNISIN